MYNLLVFIRLCAIIKIMQYIDSEAKNNPSCTLSSVFLLTSMSKKERTFLKICIIQIALAIFVLYG